MTSTTNPYCEALGIPVPRLEAACERPDANYYSLLIVALLERGEPVTLAEAAARFEQAGIAPAAAALASLKRCKPGRAPIYRDGDLYALDPHDDEADLWAFRLGLRPPRAPRLRVVREDPGPLPSPDEPLTIEHLDQAWRHGVPSGWSAQRVAICVLDAHRAVMDPDRVLAFVAVRSARSPLSADMAKYWRRGAAIRVQDDGNWKLDPAHEAVHSARQAVRERIEVNRRNAEQRPDPATLKVLRRRAEARQEENARFLAGLRRVLVHAFPARAPAAVALVDVARREVETFVGEALDAARERLADYDLIAAVDVRALLRGLDYDPGQRRLAEIGPPQKSKTLNRRGRTLKITTTLLVQGSCEIGRPFGDPQTLHRYLRDGKHTRLRRRLEADAKALFAYYQYGRLHGAVRLRWGFLDERIPAPWVHIDEPKLYHLMEQALESGVPLEVVIGTAPGWADPWSRAVPAYVTKDDGGWRPWLLDAQGQVIEKDDVQAARLMGE